MFNLDRQYSSQSFDVGHVDDTFMDDETLYIYLDGELDQEIELTAEMMPQRVNIPLNGALQMKMELSLVNDGYAII